MFEQLPETFPHHHGVKKGALASSTLFHLFVLILLISIPLALKPSLQPLRSIVPLYLPAPPPPAAPIANEPIKPAPTQPRQTKAVVSQAPAQRIKPPVTAPAQAALISPVAIPKDIAALRDNEISPANAALIGGLPGGVVGGIPGGIPGGAVNGTGQAPALPVPPPPPVAVRAPVTPSVVRVGGNILPPELIKYVPPSYPPLARKARVEGVVVLEAKLTGTGSVEDVKVLSGHALLVPSAVAAVRQWQYEPTRLNGKPVEVLLTTTVKFSLNGASGEDR